MIGLVYLAKSSFENQVIISELKSLIDLIFIVLLAYIK